jgi:hypothetical protein
MEQVVIEYGTAAILALTHPAALLVAMGAFIVIAVYQILDK